MWRMLLSQGAGYGGGSRPLLSAEHHANHSRLQITLANAGALFFPIAAPAVPLVRVYTPSGAPVREDARRPVFLGASRPLLA